MARFWITSDERQTAQASDVCSQAGLEEYGRIPLESIYGATYRKRRLSNQNLVSKPGGSFAASTGTLIYDREVGKEALLSVLEDFTGDITEVQEKALGHYSLLISTGDRLYVFCDPEQSYDIYYSTASTDGWVVTSHLSVLGACLEDLTVDTLSLYERILQKSDINGTTLYKETEKLLGHEHLVIDLDSAGITLQEHSLPPSPLDLSQPPIEEAVTTYARHVSDTFKSITQVFPESVGLQLTGGLDSRTILAALLSIEQRPRTFTGVADDQITTADPRDIEVVELLADRFDLETNRLDWSANHLETPDSWGEYFDRYGFYYTKFGAMQQFFDDWEQNIQDHPKLMMKGLSPAFTSSQPWETTFHRDRISLPDLVEKYYYHPVFPSDNFPYEQKFKKYLVTELVSAIKSHYNLPYPNESLPVAEYTKLKSLIGRHAQSYVTNLRSEFSYYLAPFNMHTLFRPFLSIPDSYRQGNEFQLRLMQHIQPDILDEPVISGAVPGGIQRLSSTRIEKGSSITSKGFQQATRLPNPIFSRLRHAFMQYQNLTSEASSQEVQLREFYLDQLEESALYDGDIDFEGFYQYQGLGNIKSFVLYDFGINRLGYDSTSRKPGLV